MQFSSGSDDSDDDDSANFGGQSFQSDADVIDDVMCFSSQLYSSKEDIVNAVSKYNELCDRAFRVAESNRRRYKTVCAVSDCEFKAPGKLQYYTCSVTDIDYSTRVANRSNHAKQITRNIQVRELFSTHGRHVSPRMIRAVMLAAGLDPSYKNCLNAKTRLMVEFFGHELEQYEYLPWHLKQLQSREHHCSIEVAYGVFQRLGIVYRKSVQSFAPYVTRGLAVDGTFLKTSPGGMLLVACFRNGNNELQIVAVAVISIENESNWSRFLNLLLAALTEKLIFVVSGREKDHLPAMQHVCPSVPHLFCFRHIMENFNKKFKSKLLKKLA